MRDLHTTPADYLQRMRQWQERRLADLLTPSGWLSLTGFGWLDAGSHRIGSAADNDIVLLGGPGHLGVVTLTERDDVWLRLAPGSAATIDGNVIDQARLSSDGGGGKAPSTVRFGTASLYVIERDGRKALRARDDAAAQQVQFAGLDYFAVDPAWRVIADWMPFDPPRQLLLRRRLGSMSIVEVPGQARFRSGADTYTLWPYQERPGADLLFVLADQTSGEETYDKARFLYAAPALDGKLVLDFNQAHNPPSAFTSFANCPMAPAENTLALRVTAGEKRYRGHGLA